MKKFSIKPNPHRTCSIKRVNAQGGNIYCYAARCPERDYYHSDENAVDKKDPVLTLYLSNLLTEKEFNIFVAES